MGNHELTALTVRFLATGIVCVGLGFFVLMRERSSAAGRVFFVYAISLAFWFVGAAMGISSSDAATSLFWTGFGHHGVNLVPAAIYHFTTVAVGVSRTRKQWIWINWFVGVAFVIAAVSWDGYVGDPYRYSWGFYPRYTIAGAAFAAYYGVVMAVILRHYYRAFSTAPEGSVHRKRSRILLVGFTIGLLGALDFLPAFGVDPIAPSADIPILVLVIMSTYVAVKYRLVEITPEFAADRILRTISDGLLVVDFDGVIRIANDAAEKLFEHERLHGRQLADLGREPFGEQLQRAAFAHRDRVELALPVEDGDERMLLASFSSVHDHRGEAIARVVVLTDVTEQRRYDELIRKAQKMESLGLMAGGIAHDFNNILTSILGNVDLAATRVKSDSPARSYLSKAISGAQRAAGLADQMLTYAGRAHTTKKEFDLNEAVNLGAGLVDSTLVNSLELRFELVRFPLSVFVDVAQVERMVANLITNAAEAIGAGGTITIWTDRMDVSGEFLRDADIGKSMPTGHYALLVVADTGEGMDEHTIERVFDPFFSTKFTGRGLGLATVSGAVRAHDGILKIESKPSRGTTVSVLLPLLDDAEN